MGNYFGTDGFRGEANLSLTPDHAFRIGRYLGYLFSQNHPARVVIGKDTRRSSYMLEYALVAGLTASGADAYLLHVTTTPSVAYVVRTEGFDGGVMISASHNPFYDNGIKLISSSGEKMSEAITDEIEAYLDQKLPDPPLAKREKIGAIFDHSVGRNRYIGYLISLATRSFQSLSIGLDCANGSAWTIAKAVFEALGAKTYTIHNEPNGLNVNQNCGSTHIESLCRLVKEKQLDVGFAFDGDADRCLAVDHTGSVVSGDHLLYLFAKYMKTQGELKQNTVVTTVMSNLGLQKALQEIGIRTVKTAVGDRFVYEAMQQNGYSLGGEESGHIIFSKYATTGDGILTALKTVEVMLESKESLAHLTRDVKLYPQLLKNVRTKDKNKLLSSPALRKAIAKEEAELKNCGRLLVRASGTEPLIRVMAEAESEVVCEQVVSRILSLIAQIENE